jgi:drug/metabolite transporter (DMT)-like permease
MMAPVNAADYARLAALAAIWGASFLFMRVAAPVLGPAVTADARVLLAGIALALWFRATGFDPQWRRHWRGYAAVGVVNSGVPFFCYAFAAMHIPASLSAILNSTAPMFGAAAGALWLGERITARKALGLAAGIAGVALVSQPGGLAAGGLFGWAVAACLVACLCYGLAGVLIRRLAPEAPPRGMAAGSQLAAGIFLLPVVPLWPPLAAPGALVLANVLALALLSSAVAYVIYFRLIASVGATRALTVTFLIPLFGVFWGWLFLGETLPASALAGGALILAGTALVTRG